MLAAIPFPDISPEIFSITVGGITFALRWYALAYIMGILLGWQLALRAVRRPHLWRGDAPAMSAEQLDALLTWLIVGIIVGGRLGSVLFYNRDYYFAHPAEIPMIWKGGMSFHGGFLGVVVTGLIFCWRNKLALRPVGDLLALGTPPGLFLGRIANFINAELWGRPTDMPWGVIFPGEAALACSNTVQGLCARHPSQLYEAALEGLILGALLIWLVFARKALKRPGLVMGMFIAGYGIARVIVENYRLADAQFITPDNPLGQVLLGLTMGQLLSLPMIAIGLLIAGTARK